MKVLFYESGVGRGGSLVSLYNHIKAIKSKNPDFSFAVILISYQEEYVKKYRELGGSVYIVPDVIHSPEYKLNLLFTLVYKICMWPFYNGFVNLGFIFLLRMFNRNAIAYIKKIIIEESVELVHTNVQVWRDKNAIIAASDLQIPVISHLRVFNNDKIIAPYSKFINRQIKKIIAISELVKTSWVNKASIDKDKIEVIYNPFDTKITISKKSRFLSNYSIEKDSFKYCIIARLEKPKGIMEALENHQYLLSKKINCSLFIIGDGPLMPKIESFINDNNLLNVYLCGYVPNPTNILNVFDLLVSYSYPNYEAFGRTIIEGMLSQVPVLSLPSGGIIEIIEHKKNGILGNYEDKFSIAKEIVKIINKEYDIDKLVAFAYKDAVNRFSYFAYLKEIKCVYSEFEN